MTIPTAKQLQIADRDEPIFHRDPPGPFSGVKLWVDPNSAACKQVNAWKATQRLEDAAKLNRIAAQPWAKWFGDWEPDIVGAVDRYVSVAAQAGCLPLMVLYNIPGRDAGHYSEGGAANDGAYRTWIAGVARGIRGRKVAIVLEPDALALNLPSKALVGDAVGILRNENIYVYIDAGDVGWWPVATMADRLKRANIAEARGFALNTSHFTVTSETLEYGAAISAKLEGKHFVIDTSRNGIGWSKSNPEPEGKDGWCNPIARLGEAPLTRVENPRCDALLWVKTPGASDGTWDPRTKQDTAPKAGTFWLEYAMELVKPIG